MSTQALPADWFASNQRFASLAVPEWATHQGTPAGLVCTLQPKTPAWYLQLWRAPQLPLIIDGGTQVYAPMRRVTDTAQLLIKFNNAYGKSVFQELIQGVVSLGLSTLRLIPDGIKWWEVSLQKMPLTLAGAWGSIECRTVSADDLTRWAEPVLAQLNSCTSWECLQNATAMLGPWDERLLPHARRIQRSLLDEREARLARSTTSVRGMTVVAAKVTCRSSCALELIWRNDTTFAMPVLTLAQLTLEGLDASGQRIRGTRATADLGGTLGAGASQSLSYPLLQVPSGRVAFEVQPQWGWKMGIPGTTMVEGTLITVGLPRCEGGKVTVPMHQQRLRGSSLSASGLITVDGVKHRATNAPLQMDSPDCALPTVLELKPDVLTVPIATN